MEIFNSRKVNPYFLSKQILFEFKYCQLNLLRINNTLG